MGQKVVIFVCLKACKIMIMLCTLHARGKRSILYQFLLFFFCSVTDAFVKQCKRLLFINKQGKEQHQAIFSK